MRNSDPLFTRSRPTRRATRIPTVCVVDPQADDYQGWESLAKANGLRLQFVRSAQAALRVARTAPVDLWVINTRLPDIPGFDLCQMQKKQCRRTPVYLVADEYSASAERAAWRAHATAFLCKPMHECALAGWLERARGVPPSESKSVALSI